MKQQATAGLGFLVWYILRSTEKSLKKVSPSAIKGYVTSRDTTNEPIIYTWA